MRARRGEGMLGAVRALLGGRAVPALLASLLLCATGSPLGAQEARPVPIAYAAERTADGGAVHDGELVRVVGVATTAGWDFYGGVPFKAYLQEGESAIALFSRTPMEPVKAGDRVEAEGRVQSFVGTIQLGVRRVRVLGQDRIPEPVEVAPEELLGPRFAGRLVRMRGVVSSVETVASGLDVSFRAGNGILVAHLTREQSQRFPRESFPVSATVEVRGIASQFDREAPFDTGWQILPRTAADVTVVQAAPIVTGQQLGVGVVALLTLLVGVGAWNFLLHRQVRQRTEEHRLAAQRVIETNRGLVEAIRLKDEVVSIVAHDFRSPLTLIQGYAETLEQRVAEPDLKRMLAVIVKQSRHLANLAADTLILSRLETGSLVFERRPLDLAELVRSAVEARSDESGAAIDLDVPAGPVTVEGDPDRLSEVLDNLVGNALKYSGGKPRVLVRLRLGAEGAEVSVEDDGLPIPQEDMPKLFQKFSRLTSARERHIPGTGLGLYICRCIVDAHGGRIWATSGESGATFTFVLPLARAAA